MRELMEDQCLNVYFTPMLKPSKLSDLFPHPTKSMYEQILHLLKLRIDADL